jgi:archaellum component FlaC
MTDKEKISTANKLCESISEKVERARWEDKFNIATMVHFQEDIKNKIQSFYRRINGSSNTQSTFFEKLERKDVETYKVICEIVKLEHFTKDILPESYNSAANKSLEKFKEEINNKTNFFCKKIFDNLGSSIEKKRKKYCIDKVVNLISEIVEQVEESVFKKYLDSITEQVLSPDSHTINFISDRFNRNIYFLESSKRLPYKIPDVSYKKKKSIVVIWLGDYHYEPVGKLLSQNRIQREFNTDDELITTINTFLYKPRQVSEKYPHLTKYLNTNSSSEESNEEDTNSTRDSSSRETSE